MTVDNYGLASFNEANSAWEAPAGTYKVLFAANVNDVRASADYKLKKDQSWKVSDVLAPTTDLKEISVSAK